MKLTANRTIRLSPTKKVERGETFTVSDELAKRYIDRDDAKPVTAGKDDATAVAAPVERKKA